MFLKLCDSILRHLPDDDDQWRAPLVISSPAAIVFK